MKKSFLLLTLISFLATGPAVFADGNQKCPVTGDQIGGDLGPPVVVTYKGKSINLCCKSCLRKFNANPEKYASQVSK